MSSAVASGNKPAPRVTLTGVDATVNTCDVTVPGWKSDLTLHRNVDVKLPFTPIVAKSGGSGFLPCEKPSMEVADGKGKLKPPGAFH